MTAFEQDTQTLYDQIVKLRAENEALLQNINDKDKEISDAEDSYEDLHDKFENLQQNTEIYTANQEYFDKTLQQAQTLRDFVLYVVEECEIDPDNEHVFRCFKNQAVHIVKNLEV